MKFFVKHCWLEGELLDFIQYNTESGGCPFNSYIRSDLKAWVIEKTGTWEIGYNSQSLEFSGSNITTLAGAPLYLDYLFVTAKKWKSIYWFIEIPNDRDAFIFKLMFE